jgi:O-antigen/teichoic acid export membrane protein
VAARPVADSLSKSIVLIAGLMIAQRAVGFLRGFYVCGQLSPAEVGRWDLAFNFLVIGAPLVVFGIPGSFGRYVSRYEQNRQRGRFLSQTLLVCVGLMLVSALLIFGFREQVAAAFFGNADDARLVGWLACGLPLVVLLNFGTSWFTGRRMNRFVFRIQFAQTLFFAVLCVLFLQWIPATAEAVVFAWLASCLAGICLAASYALMDRSSDETPEVAELRDSIWRKILPFAVWVWISNTLFNLFSFCDRLLLVNFHAGNETDTRFLIGQYHTACLLPALLMTLGAMAGSTLTPYLSKDWESGQCDAVRDRINFMLKAIGLIGISASVAILFCAPILFSGIWKDKFALGESLLPLALAWCSLAAVTLVAQKYFWCIEKTWIASILLFVGLATNFAVGVALIGPFGITGVAVSTLVAHAVVLGGVLLVCRRYEMKFDRGALLIVCLLPSICFGKWIATLALMLLAFAGWATEILFSRSEKQAAAALIPFPVFFRRGHAS